MDSDRRKKVNYSIALVAAAFLVLLAIQYFTTGTHIQQIPYSQFKQLLAEGKVQDIVVSAEQVQGSTRDPSDSARLHAFTTTRVEDPSLVQ